MGLAHKQCSPIPPTSLFYKGIDSTRAKFLFAHFGMGALDQVLTSPYQLPMENEENEFKAGFPTCLNQTGMKLIQNWESDLQSILFHYYNCAFSLGSAFDLVRR